MDRKRNVLISWATLAIAALVTVGLGIPPVASATPTIIGTCMTIGSAGSYVVDKNLTASGDHCLVIEADDVTIDLAGFRLMGDGTAGASGITDKGILRRNIAIRNGTIQGFAHRGIDLAEGRQIKVEEVRLHTNGGGGIFGGHITIVKDCIVESNGSDGIVVNAAVVTGKTVRGNTGSGIVAAGQNTLINNTAIFNSGDGMVVEGFSILTNNTASFNSGRGILLFPGGIVLGSCCNTLTSNTASRNGGHGIFAITPGITFTGNAAGLNGGDGMRITGPFSTLTGNTASLNLGGTGISVTCPSNLNGNTASNNGVANISTAGPGCKRSNNLPGP